MDNKSVNLHDREWEQAKELEDLLLPLYTVTKKLQAEDLTPGAFYLDWKRLHFKMDQAGGLIAEKIRDSMKKRESKLLDNDVLLAGIYVDPKSRILLSTGEKQRAKASLLQIAERKRKLEKDLSAEEAEDREVQDLEEMPYGDDNTMLMEAEDFDMHLDEMSNRCSRDEPEDVQLVENEEAKF